MKVFLKFIVVFLMLIPLITTGQIFKRKLDKIDENGKRQGLWITYWDVHKKIKQTKYYYEDGREIKVCKEYYHNGKVRLKFRYYRKRIRVKYFNENRQLTHKGWSRLDITGKELHYYWDGKWKFYNNDRKLVKVEIWEMGELTE